MSEIFHANEQIAFGVFHRMQMAAVLPQLYKTIRHAFFGGLWCFDLLQGEAKQLCIPVVKEFGKGLLVALCADAAEKQA